MRIVLLLGALLILAPSRIVEAQTRVMDFDSLSVPIGECADASAYLASFGVSFTPITTGTKAMICNVTNNDLTPASPPNVFLGFAPANTDMSYELRFQRPLTELSFVRTTVPPHTALPPWSAYAYNVSNTLLSSIMEPLRYPGPPAATFRLAGPGMTRVRINIFNSVHVSYNHPPFDNMVLTTAHAVCAYAFSGGSGVSAVRFCVTQQGTIAQLSGPEGQEHVNGAQVWEGYVVCTGTVARAWDLGLTKSGFDDTILLSPPTSAGVSIRRISPQFLLDQVFKLDRAHKAVLLTSTLTNISGAALPDVRLARAYDPDVNGDADDREVRSARGVWAGDLDAVSLTGTTWAIPTDTAVGGTTAPACLPQSAPAPALTDDASLASVTYRLGNMPAGTKRTVVHVYRIQ